VAVAVVFRGLALSILALLLVALLPGGCGFSPDLASGTLGCSDGGTCPPGLSCAADGHC
jgi:hypothetical protein